MYDYNYFQPPECRSQDLRQIFSKGSCPNVYGKDGQKVKPEQMPLHLLGHHW